MKFKFFVGIDVSKLTLDLMVKDQDDVLFQGQVSNDKKGLRAFEKECKARHIDLKKSLICMEHTGIYNAVSLAYFYQKNYAIWLENAIQIKQSMGLTRGKNDKVDALRIGEYACRYQDKTRLWEPEREVITQIKYLSSLRKRLIDTKNQLAVPLKEMTGTIDKKLKAKLEKFTAQPIRELEKKIKEVETEIKKVITSDQRLSELYGQVCSVDGVGEVLFCEIIGRTNEFKDITEAKKFACYAGVAPFEHSSGSSVRGKNRVSRMGNKSTKRLLHMAALSVLVRDGELGRFYNRKIEEGKNKMSVINAVRNKIIHRVFACVKENRKYDKTYTHQLA